MIRTCLRTAKWALVLSGVAFAFLFWPQSLGGSVSYVRVDGHSMDPTFHNGDLAVVKRQASYQIGDPVAYRIPQGEFGAGALVIHRLIGGNGGKGFTTKGDNRTIADEWHPKTADIIGRVRFDIPHGGIILAQLSRPVCVGGLVAGLTVLVMLLPSGGRRKRDRKTADPAVQPAVGGATANGLVHAGGDLVRPCHSGDADEAETQGDKPAQEPAYT